MRIDSKNTVRQRRTKEKKYILEEQMNRLARSDTSDYFSVYALSSEEHFSQLDAQTVSDALLEFVERRDGIRQSFFQLFPAV